MPQIIYDFSITTWSTALQGRIELPSYDIWSQSPSCCLMKLEIRGWGHSWHSTVTSWSGHVQVCWEVAQRPQQLEEEITSFLNKWVCLLSRNISQTFQSPLYMSFVLFSLSCRCNLLNPVAFCIIHISVDSHQTLHQNKLIEIILSILPFPFPCNWLELRLRKALCSEQKQGKIFALQDT